MSVISGRGRAVLWMAFGLVLLAWAPSAHAAPWIVTFEDNVSADDRMGVVAANGAVISKGIYGGPNIVVDATEQQADDLRSNSNVLSVVADGETAADGLPTDPFTSYAYGMPLTGWNQVWPAVDGTGITIAVIDGGFNVGIDDFNGKVVSPWDFKDGDNDVADLVDVDEYNHGTYAASVALAIANNGAGIPGYAPGASLMPLRATSGSDITAAINYAVLNGADVISISRSSASPYPPMEVALDDAQLAGVNSFCSSSNNGLIDIRYPAGFGSCHAIGATDNADAIASFSTGGSHLALTGPGVAVPAISSGDADPEDDVFLVSGTSFSTPMVAGVAALLRDQGLTEAQTFNALKTTAVDLGAAGRDDWFGWGRVDVAAALSAPTCGTTTRYEAAAPTILVSLDCSDAAPGSIASVSIEAQPGGGAGTVAPSGSDVLWTTPSPGWTGVATFDVIVTDNEGIESPVHTATLDVSVTGNDPPTAGADTITTTEDTAGTVNALANDVDTDGVIDTFVTIATPPSPAAGTAAVNPPGSGTIEFTPAADVSGSFPFTYQVCDDEASCSTATVTANVSPVNDAPTIVDNSFAVSGGVTTNLNVLGNDYDPEGALTVAQVNGVSAGSAVVGPGNTVAYTAPAAGTTSATLSYQACDTDSVCDWGTVTLTITPEALAVSNISLRTSRNYSRSTLTIRWTPATYNSGNAAATLLRVYRPDGSLAWSRVVTGSSRSISGLRPGRTYTVRVTPAPGGAGVAQNKYLPKMRSRANLQKGRGMLGSRSCGRRSSNGCIVVAGRRTAVRHNASGGARRTATITYYRKVGSKWRKRATKRVRTSSRNRNAYRRFSGLERGQWRIKIRVRASSVRAASTSRWMYISVR